MSVVDKPYLLDGDGTGRAAGFAAFYKNHGATQTIKDNATYYAAEQYMASFSACTGWPATLFGGTSTANDGLVIVTNQSELNAVPVGKVAMIVNDMSDDDVFEAVMKYYWRLKKINGLLAHDSIPTNALDYSNASHYASGSTRFDSFRIGTRYDSGATSTYIGQLPSLQSIGKKCTHTATSPNAYVNNIDGLSDSGSVLPCQTNVISVGDTSNIWNTQSDLYHPSNELLNVFDLANNATISGSSVTLDWSSLQNDDYEGTCILRLFDQQIDRQFQDRFNQSGTNIQREYFVQQKIGVDQLVPIRAANSSTSSDINALQYHYVSDIHGLDFIVTEETRRTFSQIDDPGSDVFDFDTSSAATMRTSISNAISFRDAD